MPAAAKVRLHVAHPVGEGQTVPLDRDQAHYLFGVMRLGPGDRLFVFNQTSGEWLAEVAEAGKRGGALRCLEQTRARRLPADVWLLFAPIKKERTDFIVEKATEQCGGTVVPEVRDLVPLDRLLADWPAGRRLMFCDEELAGAGRGLGGAEPGPWAILIGPEGGFSAAERGRLAALPFATAVSLGPRILRADTAAVAALTLWQTALGDWG